MRVLKTLAFLMAFPTLAHAANIYEIQNVTVSEPDMESSAAREKGMADAQKKALDELQSRLLTAGFINIRQNIPASRAATAVDSLDIVNEKISAGSYTATYNVIFSPLEISKIFQISKIEPTKDPQKFLVLPIVTEDGKTRVWKNDWLKTWQDSKKPDIIIPLGDLQDIQNFKEEDLGANKLEGLNKMQQRYGTNNVVLVKSEYLKSKNVLDVELTKIKGTERTVINYEYPGNDEITQDELAQAATNDISYRLENDKLTDETLTTSPNATQAQAPSQPVQEEQPKNFKIPPEPPEPYSPTAPGVGYLGGSTTTLPPSVTGMPATPAPATTPVANGAVTHNDVFITAADLVAWSRIRNKISKTPGVSDLQIKSFTAGRAYVSLGHTGDMASLNKAFAAQGLELHTDGTNWEIKEK